MTTTTEVIDGNTYLVTRDEAGNIIRQIAADTITFAAPPHIQRIRVLLGTAEDKVFRDNTALTVIERDRLIVLIARMLYQKSF